MRYLLLPLLTLLAACSEDTDVYVAGDPSDPSVQNGNDGGAMPTGPMGLAKQVAITDVAVFQAVKVPVVTKGTRVQRTLPVVAGRSGVIRVYVAPESGASQDVIAVLSLKTAGGMVTKQEKRSVVKASTDAEPASVFDFAFTEAELGPDTTYSVSLMVAGAGDNAASSPARYPTDGSFEAMGAQVDSDTLKVVLVPIRYRADGSNRLPDTSPARVAAYAQGMKELYPVAKVDVQVHAPVDYTARIAGDDGLSPVLDQILAVRQRDRPAPNVYYYGLVMPADTETAACASGCSLGLSFGAADATDSDLRTSVGFGFPGNETIITMQHEIGHAHGRDHAPCGNPDFLDPSYPSTGAYAGGSIGSVGYNITTKQFIPATHKDVMGYCAPNWISDYNYGKLYERIKLVNRQMAFAPSAQNSHEESYRMASVLPDGALVWHEPFTRAVPLAGRTVEVAFKGAGTEIQRGVFSPYDHRPGGVLIVKEPSIPWTRAVVQGQMVAR